MIKISLIICFYLVALYSTAFGQQVCSKDTSCSSYPYGLCEGGVDECPYYISGLAIDKTNGLIYFMQSCRTDSYENNITLKSVSIQGGVAKDIQTRVDIPAPGNPINIYAFINNEVYYEIGEREPGENIGAYNVATNQDTKGISTDILSAGWFGEQLDFGDNVTYVCNYLISDMGQTAYALQRINGIIGQNADTDVETLYTFGVNSYCGPIRKPDDSSFLYFIAGNTFERLSLSPSCSNSSCSPQQIFVSEESVMSFDVYQDSVLYYGTSTGLYSVAIAGGAVTTIVSGDVNGVRIFGNTLYWNDGTGIKSKLLDSDVVKLVNESPQGQCTCLPGFFGDNCNSCTGVVQWNYGAPSCVAVVEGLPVSCAESWQCGNVPYTVCVGSCACAYGFTGLPSCTTCESPKVVTWTEYGPTCN